MSQTQPEWAMKAAYEVIQRAATDGVYYPNRIAEIITRHASSDRLRKAAEDALTILEPLRFNGVPLTQLIAELRAALSTPQQEGKCPKDTAAIKEWINANMTDDTFPAYFWKGRLLAFIDGTESEVSK